MKKSNLIVVASIAAVFLISGFWLVSRSTENAKTILEPETRISKAEFEEKIDCNRRTFEARSTDIFCERSSMKTEERYNWYFENPSLAEWEQSQYCQDAPKECENKADYGKFIASIEYAREDANKILAN